MNYVLIIAGRQIEDKGYYEERAADDKTAHAGKGL